MPVNLLNMYYEVAERAGRLADDLDPAGRALVDSPAYVKEALNTGIDGFIATAEPVALQGLLGVVTLTGAEVTASGVTEYPWPAGAADFRVGDKGVTAVGVAGNLYPTLHQAKLPLEQIERLMVGLREHAANKIFTGDDYFQVVVDYYNGRIYTVGSAGLAFRARIITRPAHQPLTAVPPSAGVELQIGEQYRNMIVNMSVQALLSKVMAASQEEA